MRTKYDCCEEEVHQIDEHKLCFSCALVQDFANIIEEKTEDLCPNCVLDLASELVEHARDRILTRTEMAPTPFLDDVAAGMVGVAKDH
jgi:hypothetical protein